MGKLSRSLSLVIALSVSATITFAQLSKPEKLYQQALYEMEGLGNYSRAVALFSQILIDFPKEKSTAARALLQIGMCFEKLGQENVEKAVEAYQKVVNGYPDQAEAVKVARRKLATLSQARRVANVSDSGMSLRRLPFKQLNTPFARLSPDGRRVAYVEYSNGNKPMKVRVLDLSSGTDRVLVEGNVGGIYSLVWSPDNKSIAYTDGSGHELREIPADSGESRVVWKHSASSISPFSWSRDGTTILCGLTNGDSGGRAVVLTPATGDARFLHLGETHEFSIEGKLSPDGKYIVAGANRRGNTDVYLWSVDGKHEIRLTDHPARDDNPQWSPDGKYIVFLSDRARSADLWAIGMQDSAASGPPFLVKRDIGWRTLIYDFVPGGKLLMLMLEGGEPENLLTLPINGDKGIAKGSLVPISTYATDHFQPRWSPKGDVVAYTSRKGQVGRPRLFVLREDGTERELSLRGHYATSIAWHPNGIHLFFVGWDSISRTGIYQISTVTQEISLVLPVGTIDRGKSGFAGALVNVHYLPESRRLMFFKLLGGPDVEVLACDVDGANVQSLSHQVRMPRWGWPSPDGRHVSYIVGDTLRILLLPGDSSESIAVGSPATPAKFGGWAPDASQVLWIQGTRLSLFSFQDGKSRALHEVAGVKSLGEAVWSPSGACVAFVVKDSSVAVAHQIVVVDQKSGSVQTRSEAPKGYPIITGLQWSPTGNKILASGGTARGSQAPTYEYWVMENVLQGEETREK